MRSVPQDDVEEVCSRSKSVSTLVVTVPCPCTLDQALLDVGRFTALPDCDMFGDHRCHYTQGAQHCVLSAANVYVRFASHIQPAVFTLQFLLYDSLCYHFH